MWLCVNVFVCVCELCGEGVGQMSLTPMPGMEVSVSFVPHSNFATFCLATALVLCGSARHLGKLSATVSSVPADRGVLGLGPDV